MKVPPVLYSVALLVISLSVGYYFVIAKPQQEAKELAFEKEKHEDQKEEEERAREEAKGQQLIDDIENIEPLDETVCQFGTVVYYGKSDCYHACSNDWIKQVIALNPNANLNSIQDMIDIGNEMCHNKYPYDE